MKLGLGKSRPDSKGQGASGSKSSKMISMNRLKTLHRDFQNISTMLTPFSQQVLDFRAKLHDLENWKSDMNTKFNNFNIALMDLMALNETDDELISDNENGSSTSSSNGICIPQLKTTGRGDGNNVNGDVDWSGDNFSSNNNKRRSRNPNTNYCVDNNTNGFEIIDDNALVPYNYPGKSKKSPQVAPVSNSKALPARRNPKSKKQRKGIKQKQTQQRVSLALESSRNGKEIISTTTVVRNKRTVSTVEFTNNSDNNSNDDDDDEGDLWKSKMGNLNREEDDDGDRVEFFEDDTLVEEEIDKKREHIYSSLKRVNSVATANNTDNSRDILTNNNCGLRETGERTKVISAVLTIQSTLSDIQQPAASQVAKIVTEKVMSESKKDKGDEESISCAKNSTLTTSPKAAETVPDLIDIADEADDDSDADTDDDAETIIDSSSPRRNHSGKNSPSSSPNSSPCSTVVVQENHVRLTFSVPNSSRKITIRRAPEGFDLERALNAKVCISRIRTDNISASENVKYIQRTTRAVKRRSQSNDDDNYSPKESRATAGGGKGRGRNTSASNSRSKGSKAYRVTRSRSIKAPLLRKRKSSSLTRKNNKSTAAQKPAVISPKRRRTVTTPATPLKVSDSELSSKFKIPKVLKVELESLNIHSKKATQSLSPSLSKTKTSSIDKTEVAAITINHTMPKLVPQVRIDPNNDNDRIAEDEDEEEEEEEEEEGEGEEAVDDQQQQQQWNENEVNEEEEEEKENNDVEHQHEAVIELPSVTVNGEPEASYFCIECKLGFSSAGELAAHNDLQQHSGSPEGMEEIDGNVREKEQGPPTLIHYSDTLFLYELESGDQILHYQNGDEIPISMEEEVVSMEEEKVDISLMRPIDPNLQVVDGLVPDIVTGESTVIW